MSESINLQPEKKKNSLKPSKEDSLLTRLAKLAIIGILTHHCIYAGTIRGP